MRNVNYNPDVLSCLANLSSDEVFTPPNIANQMLDLLPDELWSDKNAKFLDPATKSGVFLREIAKRLMIGLEKDIPDLQSRVDHIMTKQLFGIGITEMTSLLARRSLYCSKAADSEFSICQEFDDEAGNIFFERIEHEWKNGKCIHCGASEINYSRDCDLETHAYQFIHDTPPERIKNMKFDVIIGNPPYQLSDGGYGTSAGPLYHRFVLEAIKLKPRFLTMIIPARWYSGGKGLDEFRDTMLSDARISEIHDFPEASDCFPGVQIKGGVCFFLWDRSHVGKCLVSTHSGDELISSLKRPLLEEGCDTFIRYNEAIPILQKIKKFGLPSLKNQISASKPFGLRTNFQGEPEKFNGAVKLYQNGGVGFVPQNVIISNDDIIDKYKVFIPPLGSGSDAFPHPVLGRPFLGEPGSACTETYLVAGVFDQPESANNLITYLQTNFLRFLVLLNKPAQHATRKVYEFVPELDFNQEWSDEKLYEKFNINSKEQAFISSLVREWVE